MKLSENALKVLEGRYLLRDKRGNITETPDGLFRRVAHNVAKAELTFDSNGVKGSQYIVTEAGEGSR